MQCRKACIPKSEAAIMDMLARLQLDTQFSWQVMLDFWAAPVDFKCISHKLVIQADGSCHFKSMYDSTTGKQLDDDLRFCAAAYKAGFSVVRVHDRQIANTHCLAFLAAAVSVASNTQCIVLSPGYSTVCMYDMGCFVTYAEMLCDMLPGTSTTRDGFNNLIICS
jgi:very-short-patch-repair endonuclease